MGVIYGQKPKIIKRKERKQMDKYINHEQKQKRPIGQKHRPLKPSDYEPRDDVSMFMKRFGIREELS